MKIIRLTQSSIKSPLKITPNVIVEASQSKLIMPKSKLFSWLLPEGFPSSVHPSYAAFTSWTSIQGVSSSFLSGNIQTSGPLLNELSSFYTSDAWYFNEWIRS